MRRQRTHRDSGGGFGSDLVTERFEFADVVAFLTFWVGAGVVVAGAEVVEPGGVFAEQMPDDDQDGTSNRDAGQPSPEVSAIRGEPQAT